MTNNIPDAGAGEATSTDCQITPLFNALCDAEDLRGVIWAVEDMVDGIEATMSDDGYHFMTKDQRRALSALVRVSMKMAKKLVVDLEVLA